MFILLHVGLAGKASMCINDEYNTHYETHCIKHTAQNTLYCIISGLCAGDGDVLQGAHPAAREASVGAELQGGPKP